MANYHVELSGGLSLDEQSKAIEGEEALGSKFVGARIWVNSGNELTNLLEFEELDEEPEPPLGVPRLTASLLGVANPDWAGSWIADESAQSQIFLIRLPHLL